MAAMRKFVLALVLSSLALIALSSPVSAMTKADLVEKIERKTGVDVEDDGLVINYLLFDEANACTPSSVAHDLQKIVVLCIGNGNGHSQSKKPKEIVVVGSKVFVVPSGFFISS